MQIHDMASVRPWSNVLLLGDATDPSHAPLNLVSAPTLCRFCNTPFHRHLPGGHLLSSISYWALKARTEPYSPCNAGQHLASPPRQATRRVEV